MGVTLSGPASLHTILETDADDDMSASEEEGSSHFPLSRECNVITPPIANSASPTITGIPARPLDTTFPRVVVPDLTLTLGQQQAHQEERLTRERARRLDAEHEAALRQQQLADEQVAIEAQLTELIGRASCRERV